MAVVSDLRARREALGLTLEQVQKDTRIPLAHLAAIEEGRLEDLPEGPWRDAYVRAYRERLGLAPDAAPDEDVPVPAPPGRVPLAAVRIVAGAAVLSLLGLVAWQLRPEELPLDLGDGSGSVASDEPDQLVKVRANREVRLRILVDGAVAVERTLANGEQVEVAGKDRVEIELPAAEAARIEYNGDVVTPQGRQDEPRRIVFVDDAGGAR